MAHHYLIHKILETEYILVGVILFLLCFVHKYKHSIMLQSPSICHHCEFLGYSGNVKR